MKNRQRDWEPSGSDGVAEIDLRRADHRVLETSAARQQKLSPTQAKCTPRESSFRVSVPECFQPRLPSRPDFFLNPSLAGILLRSGRLKGTGVYGAPPSPTIGLSTCRDTSELCLLCLPPPSRSGVPRNQRLKQGQREAFRSLSVILSYADELADR